MWDEEEIAALSRGARSIDLPASGEWTDAVPLADVLERRVWFTAGGIYRLQDAGQEMFVGMTSKPLRSRLETHISGGKTWASVEFSAWTVMMCRAPEYPDDSAFLATVISRLKPAWNNRVGRPKKKKQTEKTYCSCRGPCPICGLDRITS